ncbi:hypothetical protein C8A05DRAFT_14045 [Staphylotrichum tortipilum]|uniref:Heterokaryon incompatibility domain-containing protein n=1 Tax=Staphylotrichum tortipilum TaxID=2831512 RepID=A0AAN6RVJ6_9PEZI|nr:hypothetical protein C8A05DRAFT_14045 [Staphylotrichum longicolle]
MDYRPPRASNTKAVSWEFVKDQIDTCTTEHACGCVGHGPAVPLDVWYPTVTLSKGTSLPCKGLTPAICTVTPTRLLDLGPPHSKTPVKLIETSQTQPHGPYFALSHCWGKTGRPTKTLTTNLGSFLQKLPPLPLTFEDTLSVARQLGVRYVWIDSLCIVQDDPDDWARVRRQVPGMRGHQGCILACTSGIHFSLFRLQTSITHRCFQYASFNSNPIAQVLVVTTN